MLEAGPGVRYQQEMLMGKQVILTLGHSVLSKDQCLVQGKLQARPKIQIWRIRDRFPELRPSGEWELAQ